MLEYCNILLGKVWKSCKECGVGFDSSIKNKVFCNKQCNQLFHRNSKSKQITKECVTFDKEFTTKYPQQTTCLDVDCVRIKDNKSKKEYADSDTEKERLRNKIRYHANIEKERERGRKYAAKNPDKALARGRKWDAENKAKRKEYRQNNKPKLNEKARIKYRTDIQTNIRTRLRKRQTLAIKNNKATKNLKTIESLGCNYLFFENHIEKQFYDGMSWELYLDGKIRIDHKIPLSSFDLTDEEQQKIAFHYSNQRPMWAFDNLSKGSKLDWTGN